MSKQEKILLKPASDSLSEAEFLQTGKMSFALCNAVCEIDLQEVIKQATSPSESHPTRNPGGFITVRSRHTVPENSSISTSMNDVPDAVLLALLKHLSTELSGRGFWCPEGTMRMEKGQKFAQCEVTALAKFSPQEVFHKIESAARVTNRLGGRHIKHSESQERTR